MNPQKLSIYVVLLKLKWIYAARIKRGDGSIMWNWKTLAEYVTKKHDFIQFLRFIIAPPLPHLWLNEIKISSNFVKLRMGPELYN